MHINHGYLLDWAKKITEQKPGAKILDYGCGLGNVVVEGRSRGMDMYGCDAFYREVGRIKTARTGLLGSYIREMVDGRIDFSDDTFDLVLSNQVFEHVNDLPAVLQEIHRVMRPGASMLALFPSREVFREGHFGIPFSHRMRPGSMLRFQYALTLRRLGFGRFKGKLTARDWATQKLAWIDEFCFYRPLQEVDAAFSKFFTYERIEADFVDYRLRALRPVQRVPGLFFLGLPGGRAAAKIFFFRLGGLVIHARKI